MKKISFLFLLVLVLILGVIVGAAYFAPQTAVAPIGQLPPGAATIPLTIISLKQSASSSPTVSVEYPQFPSASKEFNQAISSSTLGLLAQFRQESTDNEAAREANGAPAMDLSNYTFYASWENAQVNNHYISFIERYSYWNGGANNADELQTFNYDAKTGKMLTLADLFPRVPNLLQKISQMARQQLSETLDASTGGHAPDSMIMEGTQPTIDNFQFFTFNDFAVTIYFPKYAVAPGAAGEQKVIIPLNVFSQ